MSSLSVWDVELQAHALQPPWEAPSDEEEQVETPICLYRARTVNVLKKYLRLSIQTGRLPSLLGNLHFRARNSSYPLHTFEDAVDLIYACGGLPVLAHPALLHNPKSIFELLAYFFKIKLTISNRSGIAGECICLRNRSLFRVINYIHIRY